MKKSILMLSALLALVVSGFCLQGCSSEFDDFATEEYGYYTEEEITAIEELIRAYDLNITLEKDYYGEKQTLAEIEADFKALSELEGKYEMIYKKDDMGNITCHYQKGNSILTRSSVQNVETSKGSWSGSKSEHEYESSNDYNTVFYDFKVSINWDTSEKFASNQLKGSFTVSSNGRNSNSEIPNDLSKTGTLNCGFSGNNITFGGDVVETYGITRRTYSVTDGYIYNYKDSNLTGDFNVEI